MSAVAAPICTRITQLFHCHYPIVLPGMSWISTPPLVAAVCNAGGVGILATGPLTAEQTRASIEEIRRLAPHKTFGVGVTLLMPGAQENAQVALELQVPLINTSLGKPNEIARQVHEYGGRLMATVTTPQHAQAAVEGGADALMVTGYEAAAHGSEVGSLALIATMAKHFPEVPLVAAGGFANGAGLAAALSLGADAVAMGSRLAVSHASPLSDRAKQAICRASVADTVYGSNLDGIPARVLSTKQSQRLMASRPLLPVVMYRAFAAAQQFNIPLWKVLPGLITQWDKLYAVAQFGAATQLLEKATVDGDLNQGVQFVGQSLGVIDSVQTVDEIVQQVLAEAKQASSKAYKYFG